MNRYSLLARVAPGLTSQLENLATESLLYLLERYDSAREAFVDLATTMGYAGPSDLRFTSQIHMQNGSIPDLVGATTDGTNALLVESKFWASLTPNQPTGYLDLLTEDGEGMVLFIAPKDRHEKLWKELKARCLRAGFEVSDETSEPSNWLAAHISGGKRLACVSWSFVLGHLEEHLIVAGEYRGAEEVWQLEGLCKKIEAPPELDEQQLQSIVSEVAIRLSAKGILDTTGYSVGQGARYYRRFGTVSGHINWFVGYIEEYAERYRESVLWFGGPSRDIGGRIVLSAVEEILTRAYELNQEIIFPLEVDDRMARESIIQSLVTQVEGIAKLIPKRDLETVADALYAFKRAWVPFVAECRSVLGSELHYQALLYHCLRTYGRIPPGQLGMNVKIWIEPVLSEYFRKLDEGHAEGFGGGFEPIPDIVVFRPEIAGDWRRRNYQNTLRQMLMAIEVKASERDKGRLKASEILKDVHKLEALRIEALRKGGSDVLPAVVVVDTAPEARERMTAEARGEVEAVARERGVCLFYVSPTDESVIQPIHPNRSTAGPTT